MSLPLTSLQARQERAEEMKLAKKRADNAERNRRFLNARQRVIGVDVQSLDQQVYEKQMQKEGEKDLKTLERMKAKELNRIMEEAAEEERRLKEFTNDQLKRDWQAKIIEKKVPEVVRGNEYDVSSFQTFSGEDKNRSDRIIQQQRQMRNWVQEQVAEKAIQKYTEHEERMQYAELLKTIDRVREESEAEEKAMASMAKRIQVIENEKVINEKRDRIAKEKAEHANDTIGLVMDLSEDQAVAMDEHGRITNKAAFRGFTEGQRTKLLMENEALRQMNLQRQQADAQFNLDWATQQFHSSRAMEEAHQEEKYLRHMENEKHLKIIAGQQSAERERKMQHKADRFGSIGPGFFSDFGKSCR